MGGRRQNSTKKAALPREPRWRQSRRRSRACSPAGWGEIKHGRHRTQRCHFLKRLTPTFTQLPSRHAVKRPVQRASTLELLKLKPGGNRKHPIKNGSRPRWPGSTLRSTLARCPYCSHTPSYLQLLLCCPLYFSLLSARINPPQASTKKNRSSASECGDRFSNLYPTAVGTSRTAIPPPPRHKSSIVPRVPPGPKPRRMSSPSILRALDLFRGVSHSAHSHTTFTIKIDVK